MTGGTNGHTCGVLLTIHPKWARAILDGKKTVELRKSFSADLAGLPMYLYATAPEKAIIGVVTVGEVLHESLPRLWEQVGPDCGVTHEEFQAYYQRWQKGFGIRVRDPHPIAPVPLSVLRRHQPGFLPPMNYQRLMAQTPLWRAIQG